MAAGHRGDAGPESEARPPGQYTYGFPDTECDGWSTPTPCPRYATVRGAKHRYYRQPRQPRQDAARAVHEATGCIVFAITDGLSRAARSEPGAAEACQASPERMLHLLSPGEEPLDGHTRGPAPHAATAVRLQLSQGRVTDGYERES
ncbi:hypothetical protein GCM10015535_68700 [Streptomyces gelaticus]|uniref:PPM-type phosphatase domain-containing protein n=1 Tax=Streptomyces gelaticus TaxID=285446 RepID=A0ABQ2W9W8_9ACTN|nr:hypothetical protein GCM10015535_68700 [Streptomyces gelaticus]